MPSQERKKKEAKQGQLVWNGYTLADLTEMGSQMEAGTLYKNVIEQVLQPEKPSSQKHMNLSEIQL